ncbi:MAG: SMP-30/gluconolactonase/LRE family protein [Actinomycetota bacterium]|nr:SMP-30/gluconolactonase/LRE family protein [Actinomycetota bacterium]
MSGISRAVLALLACCLFSLDAAAWDRGRVERFASLPPGSPNPEGITADHNGDLYVSGFAPTAPSGPGKVFVFDDDGDLLRVLSPKGSSPALLGLAFHPFNRLTSGRRQLLVLDFGAGNVLSVDPVSGAATVFAEIKGGGLNALTFDRAGNVYISDSFRGIIWRTPPAGVDAVAWAKDDLLLTTGFPPFGANGMDFNRDESSLFVANTGNDTIVRIPVVKDVAQKGVVFTNSINGADGLILDEDDNVWVCANQADEIVVTDKSGKAIAKLGDFNGVRDGSPVGLLFPASLVRRGEWLYITNLSLDLRPITGQQSVDSQWAAGVKIHTVSRIRARVPGRDRDAD